MRQLFIQVDRGSADAAANAVHDHKATNVSRIDCRGPDGEAQLLIAHVANSRVEGLLADLEGLRGLRVVLDRRDVVPLRPPADEAPDQAIDVHARSPIEIFLSGLQSIGSWTGFLSYAAIAGVVVWTGLFTETGFLLTAAMLIAPFAGPAMTLALGTARGDPELLWRSALRYAASLALTIAVALLLSLALGPEVPTSLMVDRSQVSSVAVLLPLAAGAAGALNLSQPESSSLVSGAATGVLVAASLAPPAGVIGMSIAISRWDMAASGAFLLLLQLVGINLSGAVVFRLAGLRPRGVRYDRGRRSMVRLSAALTVAAAAALLTWQFWSAPSLRRSTLAQRMLTEVHAAIDAEPSARLVEADVRFTRAQIPGRNALLCEVYILPVQPAPEDSALERSVARRIVARIERESHDLTPFVVVNVVQTPP